MKLILISGKPGSGKTLVARNIFEFVKKGDVVLMNELMAFEHLVIYERRALVIACSPNLKAKDLPEKLAKKTVVIDLDLINPMLAQISLDLLLRMARKVLADILIPIPKSKQPE